MILAIDPSTTSTGWVRVDDAAVILEYGLIRPKQKEWRNRVVTILEDMKSLITTVDEVVIEEPDVQGLVGRTTNALSKITAVAYGLYGLAKGLNISCQLIPVQTWKGQLPKEVVYGRLEQIYGRSNLPGSELKNPWEHDAIDAIGLAYYYLRTRRHSDTRGTI